MSTQNHEDDVARIQALCADIRAGIGADEAFQIVQRVLREERRLVWQRVYSHVLGQLHRCADPGVCDVLTDILGWIAPDPVRWNTTRTRTTKKKKGRPNHDPRG